MSEHTKKERPRHLGRGLQSLIGPIMPDVEAVAQPASPAPVVTNLPADKHLRDFLHEIPLAAISPNPYQPRAVWNEEELVELAESVKANGIIQPIIVRRTGAGFELIAGERRLRASQIAALKTIPAIVREASDQQMYEWSLIENIHRADLNAMERARAYQRYLSEFSLTQAEAADRLGDDRSVIANYIRLLDLPHEIQEMVAKAQLAMGHARAILGLPSDDLRRKLANRALAARLSVREVERLVRKHLEHAGRKRPSLPKEPHITDLEDRLSSELGTKVIIETRKGGRRGRIIIEFYSLDEFDNITERIGLASSELLDG